MINYCVGNVGHKRNYFRSQKDESIVSIDNDEVLSTFMLDKKLYFIIGDIPFANMSIYQYISYFRALTINIPLKKAQIKKELKNIAFNRAISCYMKNLSVVEYRLVNLAAKLQPTTKTIYINFDGVEFNNKNKMLINRYLKHLSKKFEIFVSVSDYRFVSLKGNVLNFTENTIENNNAMMKNKVITKGKLKRKLSRAGMSLNLPPYKKVVLCDTLTPCEIKA